MEEGIQFSTGPEIAFDPPFRWHHLSGGAVLLAGDNNLGMVMAPGGDSMRGFIIPADRSIQSLLSAHPEIRILGRTTYSDAEEMKDCVTDNFVISARTSEGKCLATNQQHFWSGVSTVFHSNEKSSDGVIASRVASQILVALRRLERLSIAYRTVLSIVGGPDDDGSHRTITNNKYAQHIGTEFRSLLNELYALRDAVIAAAYRFRYRKLDGFQMKGFRREITASQSWFHAR